MSRCLGRMGDKELVMLFNKVQLVHHAFCGLGMILSVAGTIISPETWYISLLACIFFGNLIAARLIVSNIENQERAILIFGRIWLALTCICCTFFIWGANYAHLVVNVDDYGVWIFAMNTLFIPVCLHLSGVYEGHRLLNNSIVGISYSLAPNWSIMAHRESSLVMWLALLLGETAGMHLASLMLNALSEKKDAAAANGSSLHDVPTRPPSGPWSVTSQCFSLPVACQYQVSEHKLSRLSQDKVTGSDNFSSNQSDTASEISGDEIPMSYMSLNDMLRWFFKYAHCDCATVRMQPISLGFDDPRVEMLYTVSTFSSLHSAHTCACFTAVALCVVSVQISAATWPVAIIVIPYAVGLWYARRRTYGIRNIPRAFSEFATWHTALSILAGISYVICALRGVGRRADGSPASWASWTANVQEIADLMTLATDMDSGAGFDSSALVCMSILLMICGAHHRFVVLPPHSRMTSRSIIILSVLVGNTDLINRQLMPRALANTVLAICVLLLGELLGYSVALVRRSLFRDWLVDAQSSALAKADAAARVAAAEENALQLQRTNAAREAELAADKRLNHVIKGRCGSAINSITSFRELIEPYLSRQLPQELEAMLITPITHLGEAVEWCHRRQVFVQLEQKTYVSRATSVEINEILEYSLAGSGMLHSSINHMVAVDTTVLKLALDEIMSNALKYRRKDTRIRMDAHFRNGFVHISVTNVNPHDFTALSDDECRRVFEPGYKSHVASAMSDGVGLDSVSRAVAAADGSVRLTCDSVAQTTSVHVSLPATVINHTFNAAASPTSGSYPRRVPWGMSPQAVTDQWRLHQAAEAGVDLQLSHLTMNSESPPLGSSPLRSPLIASTGFATSPTPSGRFHLSPVRHECRQAKRMGMRRVNSTGSAISTRTRTAYKGGSDEARLWVSSRHLMLTKVAPKQRCKSNEPLTRDGVDGVLSLAGAAGWRRRGVAAATFRQPLCEAPTRGRTTPDYNSLGLDWSSVPIRGGVRSLQAPGEEDGHLPKLRSIEKLVFVASAQPARRLSPTMHAPILDSPIQGSPVTSDSTLATRASSPHSLLPTPQASQADAAYPVGTNDQDLAPTVEAGPERPSSACSGSSLSGQEPSQATPGPTGSLAEAAPNCAVLPLPIRPPVKKSHMSTCSRRSSCYSNVGASPPPNVLTSAPRSSPEVGAAAKNSRQLRCVGIDDEDLPRMIHNILFSHYLNADPCSRSVGKTNEERAAFVDIVMGVRNADLSYTEGESVPADVAILDQNIAELDEPPILGSLLCAQLRSVGFRGVTCILTGAPSAQIAQLRKLPGVDLAFDKGAGLPVIAAAVRKLHTERKAGLHASTNNDGPCRPNPVVSPCATRSTHAVAA